MARRSTGICLPGLVAAQLAEGTGCRDGRHLDLDLDLDGLAGVDRQAPQRFPQPKHGAVLRPRPGFRNNRSANPDAGIKNTQDAPGELPQVSGGSPLRPR